MLFNFLTFRAACCERARCVLETGVPQGHERVEDGDGGVEGAC